MDFSILSKYGYTCTIKNTYIHTQKINLDNVVCEWMQSSCRFMDKKAGENFTHVPLIGRS
jgi:hypothetical protein